MKRPGTPDGKPRERGQRRGRGRRALLIAAVIIVGLLLIVRFVASPIATALINRRLTELQGFTGRVDAVTFAVWRGAGEVKNFVLFERDHQDDLPIVRVEKASMVFAFRPFFRGQIGGRARVERAEINVVKRVRFAGPIDAVKRAEAEVKEHKEEAKRWQDVLREAFPVEISEFELKEGRVRFVDRTHQPVVDVSIDPFHVYATGLRNRPDGEAMPAKVSIGGVTTGDGKLRAFVQADPLARPLRFVVRFELKELSLPPINSFMLAYANADVSRGTFEVYTEIIAENGGYHGYTKPFFRDLDFRTASDKDKNVVRRLAERAMDAAASLLESEEADKVATKTPFSGTFRENQVDLWATVENLLSNAFVQALREGLEGREPSSR